jgi:hypothetical protein
VTRRCRARSPSLRFRQAVKKPLAAQVDFSIRERRRCAEGIIQYVDRQRSVLAVVTDDDRDAIAARDVDATASADGRGEDEVTDPFEPDRFAARVAGRGFEAGKNVLIVPQEIEVSSSAAAKTRGRRTIEFPQTQEL